MVAQSCFPSQMKSAPNEPPGANSRHVSRGRSGGFGLAAVAQAERSAEHLSHGR